MKYLVLAPFAFLAACSYTQDLVESGRGYAANGVAEAIVGSCVLSLTERTKTRDAVQALLIEKGSTAKVAAFDCDGDGKPDF